MIETLTADEGPHRRVESEALCVVHVLVAGEPAKHGLLLVDRRSTSLVASQSALVQDEEVSPKRRLASVCVGR
jgi:hypothetical protein